jgi:hypothetical protein
MVLPPVSMSNDVALVNYEHVSVLCSVTME